MLKNEIIKKYEDIIKEELNVKDIEYVKFNINKTYVPHAHSLALKYGKDTGKIIKFAKSGNVIELEEGKIKVYDEQNEWILEPSDYEIRYDIDSQDIAAEGDIFVKLDLEIDEQLEKEGIIRDLIRQINILRKKAGYQVDDRVDLYVNDLKDIILEYQDFIKREGLIKNIIFEDCDLDIKEEINIYDINLIIGLKKGNLKS